MLSDNFRFGFRNEGDYDLRNNQGDFKSADYQKQGFFDNNYVTSSEWFNPTSTKDDPIDFDSTKTKHQGSSYLNNFVTPIQRRVKFGEYLMEVCTKLPVSSCTSGDWSIDGKGTIATKQIGQAYKKATHQAGTTVDLADPTLQRYARRVAFARKSTGELILDEYGHPVPLGIDSSGNIQAYAKRTVPAANNPDSISLKINKLPRTKNNALWFRTTDSLPKPNSKTKQNLPTKTDYGYDYPLYYQTADGISPLTGTDANEQPLLVPVLQIQMPYNTDNGRLTSNATQSQLPAYSKRGFAINKNWLQQASPTTTNLTIAGGDTPARLTETTGGLENFIRYLEKWKDGSTDKSPSINHSLSGSIIQYKRSAYATAPWQITQVDNKKTKAESIFGKDYEQFYTSNITTIATGKSMTPFYTPPSRQWGFDVGLLSQLPDLFALTFTLAPTSKPNDFFREVDRDDKWVQSLLCAKTLKISSLGKISPANKNAVSDSQRPTEDFCKDNTGG